MEIFEPSYLWTAEVAAVDRRRILNVKGSKLAGRQYSGTCDNDLCFRINFKFEMRTAVSSAVRVMMISWSVGPIWREVHSIILHKLSRRNGPANERGKRRSFFFSYLVAYYTAVTFLIGGNRDVATHHSCGGRWAAKFQNWISVATYSKTLESWIWMEFLL